LEIGITRVYFIHYRSYDPDIARCRWKRSLILPRIKYLIIKRSLLWKLRKICKFIRFNNGLERVPYYFHANSHSKYLQMWQKVQFSPPCVLLSFDMASPMDSVYSFFRRWAGFQKIIIRISS